MGRDVKGWFWRWLVFKWAAPVAAVVAFFEAIAILYQVDGLLHLFLAQHRSVTTFCLVSSFLISFIAEIARVDRHRLMQRRKELISDKPDRE